MVCVLVLESSAPVADSVSPSGQFILPVALNENLSFEIYSMN